MASAWGRGLATEASMPTLQYGFEVLALERIWARTDPPHVASQRVIQRLGMRPAADPGTENLSLGETQPCDAPQTIAYVIDRGGRLNGDTNRKFGC